MMGFRQRPLIGIGIVLLVGVVTLTIFGIVLRGVSASPLRQLSNPVVVTSDLSEVSLLSGSIMDPDPLWRTPTFDDSGWQASYLAATLPGWGVPVGGDFIWGGPPGADVGGRYEIPPSPAPQFLFLRENFCIPINADVTSIQPSVLRMQVAASPGDASIYYNGADLGSLAGREDGFVYSVNLDPAQVVAVRRVGRNTLAISAHDNVADARAALAYHIEFSYAIDPAAITLLPPNPPSGFAFVGTPVTFSYGGTGAGGDGPYTLGWDFGNGATSTDPTPTIAYTAVGTYTVTLVMADRFGCSSEPVSMQYVVSTPPTPTPTNTPTPTSTPTPTNTPRPANTSAPPSQPANTPIPPPTPTLALTSIVPVLLPETGRPDYPLLARFAFVAGCALLLVCYFWLCRRLSDCG